MKLVQLGSGKRFDPTVLDLYTLLVEQLMVRKPIRGRSAAGGLVGRMLVLSVFTGLHSTARNDVALMFSLVGWLPARSLMIQNG